MGKRRKQDGHAKSAARYPTNLLTGSPLAFAARFGTAPPPAADRGPPPSCDDATEEEQLARMQDRAARIKRKITAWDRDELADRYAWMLLLALTLRGGSRIVGRHVEILQRGENHYHELADSLAAIGRQLNRESLAMAFARSKAGRNTGKQRAQAAEDRYEDWLRDADVLVKSGGRDLRSVAGILSKRHGVTAKAMREGLRRARNKTNVS